MSVFNALNYNNEAFRGYITWGGILIIKMVLMSFLTVFQRARKGAVENPEDARPGMEIKKDDDVERVRRAHLNDLENIPPFLIGALMYVMSEPDVTVALWLIRVAVSARIIHTIIYAIYPVPQPARMICFITTLSITVFMVSWAICQFFKI